MEDEIMPQTFAAVVQFLRNSFDNRESNTLCSRTKEQLSSLFFSSSNSMLSAAIAVFLATDVSFLLPENPIFIFLAILAFGWVVWIKLSDRSVYGTRRALDPSRDNGLSMYLVFGGGALVTGTAWLMDKYARALGIVFVGLWMVFLSFGIAASLASRIRWIYFIGIFLGTASTQCLVSAFTLGWKNANGIILPLRLGFLVMSGFIVYETRIIVDMSRSRRCDVWDLVCQFVNDFLKLLLSLATPIVWFSKMIKLGFRHLPPMIFKFVADLLTILQPLATPIVWAFKLFVNEILLPLWDFFSTNIVYMLTFFKPLYTRLNLVHTFGTIFYIYIAYRVYLWIATDPAMITPQ